MRAAGIADAAARRRVLVVGSPPPGGRDLDLLVRPEEERAVAAALEAQGFLRRANTWARFEGGSADVVDLIPAAEWGRGDALFDEAVALEGFGHLVAPAPHHELLLAATRFLRPSGRMKEGRTRRLAAGPARDDGAWRRARAQAHAWGAEAGLDRLEALLAGRPRRDLRATVRGVPARVRRHRRGVLVVFSGGDDGDRSAHAAALLQALDRLGHEAVGEPPARRQAARHLLAGRVVVLSHRADAARLRRLSRSVVAVDLDDPAPFDALAARIAGRVWRALD